MGRKLYVGKSSVRNRRSRLQELFARAGNVDIVKVMRDMATGRARGFAFVEMSTDEEAQKAIAELNDYQIGGRGLTVNEARPKPTTGGGYGDGGGFTSSLGTALVGSTGAVKAATPSIPAPEHHLSFRTMLEG